MSDPGGVIATPLRRVERPETKSGLKQIADLVEQRGAERRGRPAAHRLPARRASRRHARVFAEALRGKLSVPVELHDERLTTRLADGAGAGTDSRAAAHLLELASVTGAAAE